MRTLLVIGIFAVSAGVPALAAAQSAPSGATACFPSSHIDKVVVQMADATTRRGSLLCLGVENLTLAEKTGIGQFRLADVRRIRKAADPVWDGALKGAAIGLLPLVLGCTAECVLRTAAAYALLGSVVDAINTNMDTIYRPTLAPRAALGFRVRF
jgi:hypothetical protein